MQTSFHNGLSSFTLLTYYATFWPETGLKPIILDWPGQKIKENVNTYLGRLVYLKLAYKSNRAYISIFAM